MLMSVVLIDRILAPKVLSRSLCVAVAGLCALVVTPMSAARADWPERPVTVVVPYAAGGNTDIMARLASDALTQKLGQPFIVENRPGAEGVIGVDAGAKSAPDGYTFVLGSSTTLAANFHLLNTLPFHPVKYLEPVSMAFQGFFNILVINAAVQ
jgi:tripartite-type tricarboxylate transporter receptor subunit TctC